MRHKRHQEEETGLFGNLTAMIDVVFQIIIFFVCTSNLQDSAMDTRIKLPWAPHGKAAQEKDPREIVVDVSSKGRISIARTLISQPDLALVLKKAIKECGSSVPVVIRGDGEATHAMIRIVMDTCAASGIWKIKVSAVKEKGS